ncbi:SIR2 NAD-dependent protein deacetylase SIR2 family [Pyrenophora tritici-repentis]|uniref:NAD-dependent deacetylase sirtuin-5 n=2 Tax=Pyrenophora tritici-repentis TaxID=45151 RepID=A0A2W1ED39_9PLEO|nr:NAD-dependent deacetylase sirtuin-5 [Pyrenophora tritici-repentis Pt-1C-BFP]KAA8626324.1 NAD-dependent deacetylase sirtuin-5 [Pyrenophora tritici-repentis]EDU41091.1 NAD-dependent deacetylase sirtuin-5 [Pyrenophora tritici-repentis Pt-1C-BFP]KAF7454739.1 NAD-dependent deacetylase sirtuin-5 [Pyrenophora tritici-repentis]KAF7577868.1 SIR2, NAD-dependent protein deacetylase, SIR2 family [Pyrenophora tritici-repentis]KAG9388488.1 NAD-dependent deacetylase sirtuin-5 [Pyrenophora tritici-repentis
MASSAPRSSVVPLEQLQSFQEHLNKSTRILALLGAGLSASSGLPTFRGAGGMWRTHDATSLATPQAFERDPGLVWQFYSYRRHMALKAKPNPAHYALAELARKREEFITLSQNVDGLSPRAQHPIDKLKLLHGSLFDVKCSDFFCKYVERNNYTDPIVPALAIPSDDSDPTTTSALAARELDISDINVAIPELDYSHLPHCPACKTGLLRPGVVWFGEALPKDVMKDVDDFIDDDRNVDLIMVIGTSAKVYPAAGYVDEARMKGARVAVINMDPEDIPAGGLYDKDWFFQGDAARIVPELLKSVIGEIDIEKMGDAAEGS